ncbi:DUF2971 domain-containing protein [uncultured Acinetobacter sp.]|uniref:DUF2971 domain-containing protein n=1 Tax=uncultured Acinetobacter sp. TaxID=165433 RepID=UPI00258E59F5|nr:DUF2971 domain-containing protein [uncultured Acinetobacter sp.]
MELLKDLEGSNPLWRYMDTSKFLDLLLNSKLVFPRYDKFEDPYEGYASNYIELLGKALKDENFTDNGGLKFGINSFKDYINISNYYAYVSCWHHNSFESAGMWKLYCTTPESIVIKSNVDRLKKSFTENEGRQLIFSKVTYDSTLDGIEIKDLHNVNVFNSLLMKRESFDHEKEYRVLLIDHADRIKVMQDHTVNLNKHIDDWFSESDKVLNRLNSKSEINTQEDFESIVELIEREYEPDVNSVKHILERLKENREIIKVEDVDLNILIEEIIVSPYAPKWFVSTVEKLIKELNFDFKVSQSKLYELV